MIDAHDSVIVRLLSQLLVPLIQIYALYILLFGQQGPGGGFVGGVMLGTSLILSVLVFGPDSPVSAAARNVQHGDGLGLLVFVGVGGLCLIGGGNFLDYSGLHVPGLEPSSRRYLGILLAQVGVAMDIAVTAVSIVWSLSLIDEPEPAPDAESPDA